MSSRFERCAVRVVPVGCVAIAVVCVASFALAADEATSENDARLAQALKRYPAADLDKDGVLTQSEVQKFVAQRRAARNRTTRPAAAPNDANAEAEGFPGLAEFFEAREYTSSDDRKLLYRLMKPANYDPARSYPIVICLHGSGGRGDDNMARGTIAAQVLARPEMRAKYPAFVMAPQTPTDGVWANVPVSLRGEGNPDADGTSARGADELRRVEMLPYVFEVLSALDEEFNLDADRVYITGQSMGGVGTYAALFSHPDLFAAAVPVCGAWRTDQAAIVAHVPMWIFHGSDDKTVPVHFSRDMAAALKAAGAAPKYTEFERVGHNSWDRAYNETPEMWEWLFAQRRSASH